MYNSRNSTIRDHGLITDVNETPHHTDESSFGTAQDSEGDRPDLCVWGGDPTERYGPWKTAHERLRLRTRNGTWQKILDHVIVKDDSVGAVE